MIDTCQLCEGPLLPMGTLGHTQHLRCQDCGAEFNRSLKVRPRRTKPASSKPYRDFKPHRGVVPSPADRATAVADRAVCDRPPSQFFDEWLRVYREALREFSSDHLEEEQADEH